MTKPMKVAITLIIVAIVGVTLYGLLVLTNRIINSSYDSIELIETVPDSMNFTIVTSVVYNNPEEEYSTAKILYSSEDLEKRQKSYLGTDYDRWSGVLLIASNNYKDVVSDLNNAGFPSENDIVYDGEISQDGLKTVGKMSLSDGLDLIGMCDDTTLMFAYMRATSKKPVLIVVDASEMLLPTYRTMLYSFGDTFSVYLRRGCFAVEETAEYIILYIKG